MKNRLLFFVALSLAACGETPAPDVQDQIGDELEIPGEAPADRDFSLTGMSEPVAYKGSLIFWNEEATPDQIRAISESSVGNRKLKTELLGFVDQQMMPAYTKIAPARRAMAQAKTASESYIDQREATDPVVDELKRHNAKKWFEFRLQELVNAGTVTDRDFAINHFQAYCEAKIWELALSPLAYQLYDRRPTPNQMCEAYYEDAGFFSGELCVTSTSGYRNFFQCLWREGVLQTALAGEAWGALPCEDDPNAIYPNRLAAVTDWLREDGGTSLLERLLSDDEIASSVSLKKYSELMVEKVMGGSKINTKIYNRRLDGVKVYEALKECKPAFVREELRQERDLLPWQVQDPEILIPIGETDGTQNTAYSLIPSTSDSEVNAANWRALAQYVGLYGQRELIFENDVLVQPYAVSVSDRMSNQPEGQVLRARRDRWCRVVGQGDCGDIKGDEAFAFIRDIRNDLASLELLAEIEERKVELAEAIETYTTLRAAAVAKRDGVNRALSEGIAASTDPGAATAFGSYGLNVTPIGDRIRVDLQFADGLLPVSGCVDLQTSQTCEDFTAAVTMDFVKADDALGMIEMVIDLQDARVGFGALPRGQHEFFFNEIGGMEGMKLRLQLYPNVLGGYLQFLTGNAWLERDGEQLHTGSTSADAYAVQLNEFPIVME